MVMPHGLHVHGVTPAGAVRGAASAGASHGLQTGGAKSSAGALALSPSRSNAALCFAPASCCVRARPSARTLMVMPHGLHVHGVTSAGAVRGAADLGDFDAAGGAFDAAGAFGTGGGADGGDADGGDAAGGDGAAGGGAFGAAGGGLAMSSFLRPRL